MGSDRPGGLTTLAIVNLVWGVLLVLGTLGSFTMMAAVMSGSFGAPPAAVDAPPRSFDDPPRNFDGPRQNGPQRRRGGPGFRNPEQLQALREVGLQPFAISAVLSGAYAVLLIISGIGYLKLKKFLGRVLGNAAALVGVASALASVVMLPATLGGNFGLGSIIGLVYPAVTLLLLNVVFKEDLVR